MSAFVIRRSGARIEKRRPSSPAFVPRFATRSNAERNAGRQSGYPE